MASTLPDHPPAETSGLPATLTGAAAGRRGLGARGIALLALITGLSAILYAGLIARGELWPAFDLATTAAPLVLLALVSTADGLVGRRGPPPSAR